MMSLARSLLHAMEQATLAVQLQAGCGDKNKTDDLAVTTMRRALNDAVFRGRVVIGKGEIDHVPMLWVGEEMGKGGGPEADIAVDPAENTRVVAMGQSNAPTVIAFAPRDNLLHVPDVYMKKLVVNRLATRAIDLSLPLTDNLRNVTRVLGKPLDKLRMVTLDKPCLSVAIEEAIQLGVKTLTLPDDDVAASMLTCWRDNLHDMMYTIDGAPEGVISAYAVRALGGDMRVELTDFCQTKGDYTENRQVTEQEHKRCKVMGVGTNHAYSFDELARGNGILFSATDVMDSKLVNGIQQAANGARVQASLIGGVDQMCNIMDSLH